MIESVEVVPHGRRANEALASAIASAKAGRPLAPVTVIVPSNFTGLSARRLLGAGLITADVITTGNGNGSGVGLANVHFVTPLRLAQQLAADQLLDRRPLTNPVLGAAVRRALAEDPGPFARVAEHHATEAALASLTTELNQLDAAMLARLERNATASVSAAVAVHRRVRSHLVDFDDEAQVARAVTAHPDLAGAVASLGQVIWFVPEPASRPLVDMVGAVIAAAPSKAIVALTGAVDADEEIVRVCTQAGVALTTPSNDADLEAPVADRLVSVTDADEEVRAVLRSIGALLDDGVPLDRIGVFHPTPDPYVRLLRQHLGAAGIPFNGPSRARLADSVAGRTLLRALELPAVRWRRDRVLALVSGAPLRLGDDIVRPSVWESISRDAGVVQGLADWRAKLDTRSRAKEAQLLELDAGPELDRLRDRIRRDQADVDALRGFVDALAVRVKKVEEATGWPAKAEAASELLVELLGPDHRHTSWPEPERDAFERVEDALARLGSLADIEPNPTHAVFVRALRGELDVARGRSGRFGEGVMHGPLSAAIGLDLDAVFVLGCAEGLVPGVRRDDVLMPDAARALTDGALELRTSQLGRQHRHVLAALAAAPPGRRTMVFPRGDLRGGRHALPSRWLLDSASQRAGRTVHATDFDELPSSVVESIPSHAAAVVHASDFGGPSDVDLTMVTRFAMDGLDPCEHPLVAGAARGIVAQRARRAHRFSEWDGNLAGRPIPTTDDRPLSPSRLESWAHCGYRYFLQHVLGLRDRDDPERVVELQPLDRGSGVHEVLERFLDEVIERGAPAPDEPWTIADRERLAEIAEGVFDQYERRGRTGRPVRWRLTKSDLLAALDDFLASDDRHRAERRAVPERVELPFGLDGVDPVRLELADGRTLSFRGKADRIDRTTDGRALVSDYKTGRGAKYKGIDEGDPVQGGRTLQLGLYSEAARAALGVDEVEAHYWMVDPRGQYQRLGYAWTPDRRERMLDVVETIVSGIEGGVFPAVPGDWDTFRKTHEACAFCDFDSLCSRDRGEFAEATSVAVELQIRRGLDWDEDAS